MMILTEAIDINNKRFAGEKAEIFFYNKRLVNKKVAAVYTACTSPEEIPLIDLLPGSVDTGQPVSNKDFSTFSEKEIEDLLLFLESLLRSLSYEESNISHINKRLNFFCFKNLLFINNLKLKGFHLKKYSNELLKSFLFFNPSSEEYIRQFSLVNQTLKYKRNILDLQRLLETLEKISTGNHTKSKSAANKKTIHYTELYNLLSEIISGLFKGKAIKNINSEEEKLYLLFKENRQLFYKKLKEALSYYTVASWEDKTKAVSLFYGTKRMEHMPAPKFIAPSYKKYESEYLVDFFIFYFARSVRNLKQAIHYLSSDADELKKFSVIVFSHPFIIYNNTIKKAFAKSTLAKDLPEGYAKNKLQKYQQQYLTS